MDRAEVVRDLERGLPAMLNDWSDRDRGRGKPSPWVERLLMATDLAVVALIVGWPLARVIGLLP